MKRLFAVLVALAVAVTLVPAAFAQIPANPLKNIPVMGTANGMDFAGVLTITELTLAPDNTLLASGVLRGTVEGIERQVRQVFTDIPLDILTGGLNPNPLPGQQECQILFLELGPLFLDLLGLQVSLDQIVLDITAVAGPGNLLGNLLCAVAGLLDPPGPLANIGSILQSLLNVINQLL
jgi:hypothetical protein